MTCKTSHDIDAIMPADEAKRATRIECKECGAVLKDRYGVGRITRGAKPPPVPPATNSYGNSKVDALIAIAGPSMTERDYADLAIAALDQMGVDPVVQDNMRALVDAWITIIEARKQRERTPEEAADEVQALREAGGL